jgi:hypothetical protein
MRFPSFSATSFPSGRNSFSVAIGFPFGSGNETRRNPLKQPKTNDTAQSRPDCASLSAGFPPANATVFQDSIYRPGAQRLSVGLRELFTQFPHSNFTLHTCREILAGFVAKQGIPFALGCRFCCVRTLPPGGCGSPGFKYQADFQFIESTELHCHQPREFSPRKVMFSLEPPPGLASIERQAAAIAGHLPGSSTAHNAKLQTPMVARGVPTGLPFAQTFPARFAESPE